jgi:hypothetical protein
LIGDASRKIGRKVWLKIGRRRKLESSRKVGRRIGRRRESQVDAKAELEGCSETRVDG